MAHWRRLGIKICLFLDDGFSSARDKAKAQRDSVHVRQDLMRAGIVWNVKKSNWEPTKSLEWVGFYWDTTDGSMKIKGRRVEKLKLFLSEMSALKSCTARKLAALVGQIISMMPVIGDVARLKTRNCQIAVALANGWDETVLLNNGIKSEILFWQQNIDRLNIYYCFQSDGPVVFDLIEGDASASGCGSILNDSMIAAQCFNALERAQSSAYREISNIHFSLVSFLANIKGRSVTVKTDSQAAAKICKIGSMNPLLQHFAESIFELCFKNNINLTVDWVPRNENQKADLISRLADRVDVDDWQISPEFFKILNEKWGPFSIDLFANYYNSKCKKFYSLFYSPRSHGVDAFAHSWVGEVAIMVPPISLVPRALSQAKLCRINCTLVIPLWSSSCFWPVILNDYSSFITDILRVKGSKVLLHGRNINSIFGSGSFQGEILAINFDFTGSTRR